MSDQTDPEGFGPVPLGSEPPEGDAELALQEQQRAGDALVAQVAVPTRAGRTYAYNFDQRRFVGGGQPVPLYGLDARRQAIEKCVRTTRGAAPACPDDYGLDADRDIIDGGPYDDARMAEYEEAVRDAIMGSLPWVLDVTEFSAYDDGKGGAFASFRVVPEGEGDPLDIDRLPLVPPER